MKGGLESGLLLFPDEMISHLRGMQPRDARKIVAAAEKDFGDDVRHTAVRVGGSDFVEGMHRILEHPDTSLIEKGVGAISHTPVYLSTSIGRSDHYNPLTDEVVSYSGVPEVLAHELGHAADFGGRAPGLRRTAYSLGNMALSTATSLPVGIRAVGSVADTLHKEYQATDKAIDAEAVRGAIAKQRGISVDAAKERAREVLAPAYGTYMGGAVGALAALHPASRRVISKVPRSGLIIGGALAGHVGGRVYNRLKRKRSAKKTAAASREIPTLSSERRKKGQRAAMVGGLAGAAS